MQTYIKTWWTLKCSHHTPIFDDVNWPHLFCVFPVFTANEKVRFPGEAIHGRNICSEYKCSLRLCLWLYSLQQLSSFYSKYFFIKLSTVGNSCETFALGAAMWRHNALYIRIGITYVAVSESVATATAVAKCVSKELLYFNTWWRRSLMAAVGIATYSVAVRVLWFSKLVCQDLEAGV